MSTAVSVTAEAPRARQWRARLRRARRKHHDRSLGDTLTDLYMLLWLVLVYGGALFTTVRQHLTASSAAAISPEHAWIGVAVLLAGAGLMWQGMRTLGPLLATQAEQAWGISTPIDRRGWLVPRFAALVLAGSVTGIVAAGAVALLGLRGDGLGLAALGGAAYGLAATGFAVAAQGAPGRRRWPTQVGGLLLAAGALAATFVVAMHYGGRPLPPPAASLGPAAVAAGLPLAVVAAIIAVRTLSRLDRVALGTGAEVASAAVSASVWLDPSLLSRVLEIRRWRRIGRVRSRRLLTLFPGRAGALLQAELRRLLRRPASLLVWGALALAQYAVAVVAPPVAGVARVIGAYLAAGRLTGGLRAVSGSAGLRRAIGGEDLQVRLFHLVVPAVGAVLWWLLTWPAGGRHLGNAEIFLVAGVVGAVYRSATRKPMSYGGAVLETPFGLFPMEMLLQMARGPDLLGVVIVLQVVLAR
ncbi:MAG: DUF6297 family protein [Gemmatimonadota bacterium]